MDCEGRGASARIGLGGIQLSDSKAMIDGGSTLIKTPPLLFAGISSLASTSSGMET